MDADVYRDKIVKNHFLMFRKKIILIVTKKYLRILRILLKNINLD